MVTHLAFNIKNGEKQKTRALNNRKREKVKGTQKRQKHTYLINGRTYISNNDDDDDDYVDDDELMMMMMMMMMMMIIMMMIKQ